MTRVAALLTARRMMRWGVVLLALSAYVYVQTTMGPGLVDRVGRFKGADYVQFYVMGSFVLDGRTDRLYDADAHLAEGRRRISPDLPVYAAHPNYGPQVALAFAPLAVLPFASSLTVFLALTLACYAFSVWLIWRECETLRGHGLLIAVLAAASPLLWTVMRYGQASAFTLLAWSIAFVALRRHRLFSAGLAIGCLAFKPQLGIVLGIVLLAARQWRVVAGALLAAGGQLAVAWLAAGSATMAQYFGALGSLILDPRLVQVYPSEVHSLRGFFQLLLPSAPMVTACALAGALAVIAFAIRSWMTPAALGMRWGIMVLATILASPHLISYDLLLLTIVLLLFSDWAIHNPGHALRAPVSVMLLLLYFAPFSGMIVARLTGVQMSVVVMALLAWRMTSVCVAAGSVTKLRLKPPSDEPAAGSRIFVTRRPRSGRKLRQLLKPKTCLICTDIGFRRCLTRPCLRPSSMSCVMSTASRSEAGPR